MASTKFLPKNTSPGARKPFTLRYWDDKGQHERSFKTAGERKDFAVKFEHDSREGTFIDPRAGKMLFTDYAATWIEAKDCAPGTKQNYRNLLSKHVGPAFAGRTIAQVAQDRDGVVAMLAAMRDAGLSGSRRGLARALVTGVMDEAQAAGRITTHRLAGIPVSRTAAAKPATIIPATTAQIEALAGGLRAELALVVWLMRGCGLRISEALAVRLDGFRDGGRTLRITEQTGDGGTLGPLKHRKQGEYRDVPVPAWLWVKVEAHVDAHGTDGDGGYLFTRRDGQRVGYGSVIAQFRTSAEKAGLPALRPHGLRHLYASALLTNGVPMSEVSKFLGHANFNITHATYSHLVPSAWDRARDVLDGLAA